MRRYLFSTICFVALLAHAGIAAAQDISFEATVDRKQIALDEKIQFTISVEGGQIDSGLEDIKIEGFDVRYLGPSSRVTIINGKYSSSAAYIYNLYPTKVGQFTIPSVTVNIDGKSFSSSPIDVEVVASSALTNKEDSQAVPALSLEDKIFLVMDVSKKEAFIHEKVNVSLRLFVQDLSVSDIQYPEFEKTGFIVDEFKKPQQYPKVIDGVRYDVVEFNIDLYPTRDGVITLGPAVLNCNLVYKNKQRRRSPFEDFDSFFGRDPFDGFFGGAEKRPLSVKSRESIMTVRKLPEQGKPDNFNQAVGVFDFDVQVGPEELKVGDPITVKMKVKGDGNLKPIVMPVFKETDDFKVYEPQVKETGGEKILEQVIIPRNDKVAGVPSVQFSFFNPEKKQYEIITKGPFPVQVKAPDSSEGFEVFDVPSAVNTKLPEKIGRDIIYIKGSPGKLFRKGKQFYQTALYKMLFVIISLIFVVLVFLEKRISRVKTDIAFARRLKAPKKAKDSLKRARSLFASKKFEEFYDCVFKTIQTYFGDKFHLVSQAITYKELEEVLDRQKVGFSVRREIKLLLDICDEARYTHIDKDANKARKVLEKCEEIIDYFERN